MTRTKKLLGILGCVVLLFLGAAWIFPHAHILSRIVASFQQAPTQELTPLAQAKKLSEDIKRRLRACRNIEEKKNMLLHDPLVQKNFHKYPEVAKFVSEATPIEVYVLALASSLDQFPTLFSGFETITDKPSALKNVTSTLAETERFYAPMGGLLGYHDTILRLLSTTSTLLTSEQFVPPPYQDIRKKDPAVWKACFEGVRELPRTAQIFPIGGASDRLNLIDEVTKEPLPAAAFNFCGRSLFEWLMRDVQAASYWHYRTFGKQVNQPILLMTSNEKNNDKRIADMGAQAGWFGHPHNLFFRMIQPLVLIVDFNGKWVTTGPLKLALKPGGHGVIWKLAQDTGAFKWLQEHKVDSALVRQINNPLACLDNSFPTLVGYGLLNNKSFGFAACPIRPGFAEGMDILSINPKEGATITNIEYTHFKTLEATYPNLFKNSSCPANVNLLFASIPAVEKALLTDPIPGMLVNPKTCVDVTKNGKTEKVMAARLESSMQNIADVMRAPYDPQATSEEQKKALRTYLNLYDREKVISVTKRAFLEGQPPYETPESCLYDWGKAMRKLLSEYCSFNLPPEQTLEQFLQKGPEFTFFFNPSLGPLWEVIGQKISRGTLAPGAEVELEIAEIACPGLTVDGSLRILAERPTGPFNKDGSCLFSDRVGRAYLKNCIILNKGVTSKKVQDFIKGKQTRAEVCEIILNGFSEVVAENVTIKGNFHLTVPDGKRATLTEDPLTETIQVNFQDIQKPSWTYKVNWEATSAPQLTLEGTP